MAFIYQYKKTLYFNSQKYQNLRELLYIYIYITFSTLLLLLYNFNNKFKKLYPRHLLIINNEQKESLY